MTVWRAVILFTLAATAVRAEEARPAVPRQRPVALALSQDDKHLFVANERAGTIAVLDTEQQQVVAEVQLGGRISALALSLDDEYVLALDEQSHAVVLLQRRDSELELIERLQINPPSVSNGSASHGASRSLPCGPAASRCWNWPIATPLPP